MSDNIKKALDWLLKDSDKGTSEESIIEAYRIIKELIIELEAAQKVVEAAREAETGLELRSAVTQCHATGYEIGVLRRLKKALEHYNKARGE